MVSNPYEPDEIRVVVSVACPVCDGLTPVAEGTLDHGILAIHCNHCSRAFDVPDSSIRDAQNQCRAALGEA